MGLAWVQARFESVVQVSWTVTLTQKRIWQQLLSLCDIRFAYYLIIIRFHTFEEKFSSLSFVSDAKQNSIVNLHKIFMYRSQNPSLKACISNISEKKTIESESENYSNENKDFFPAPAERGLQSISESPLWWDIRVKYCWRSKTTNLFQ